MAVLTLLSRCNVTLEELENKGSFAVACGISLKSPTKTIPYSQADPSHTVEVFRSIQPSWDSIEGTIPHQPIAIMARFSHFFRAGDNTCAIDVCLSMAITLGVHVIQHDRITPLMRKALSVPARLLHDTCQKRLLSPVDGPELAGIRDMLAAKLEQHDRAMFTQGHYLELSDVFDVLFARTPQFTFTTMHANSCCDKVLKFTPGRRPSTTTFIYATRSSPHQNLSAAITRWFVSDHIIPDGFPCTRPKDQCVPHSFRAQVVLDCLPPRLVIKAEKLTIKDNVDDANGAHAGWGFGHRLNFEYYDSQLQRTEASYVAEACVLWVGENHYVYRLIQYTADGTQRILEWDHLAHGKVVVVSSLDFFHGRKKAAIYMMVYRMVKP